MSDNVAQLSEAMAIMRTKDVQHLINRIKELEAKLAKAIHFLNGLNKSGDYFTEDLEDLVEELQGDKP